jgi:trypsin
VSIKPVLVALAAALVAATTAAAITGGRLDGAAHPYVGALVVDGSVECSGVLVAPKVFATAAHCTAGLADGAPVSVSFDTSLDRASWTLRAGRAHIDPAYTGKGADPHDLAVVVLDEPAGITPAALPPAGSVEAIAKGTAVTSVGYGYYARSADGSFLYDGLRRAAESPVAGVSRALLKLSTRDAGPCMGDSGGPQLQRDTVLSLTSGGAKDCTGKAESYRLDTASARGFLSRYVQVP